MLGSITPLGQRARGFRFWPTATAYIVASAVGGAVIGALLGAIGAPFLRDVDVVARSLVLAALALVGLAMDLGWFGLRLPGAHRQVDEDWMSRYRGPIYGAGFGFQLGLGVVTIVTTSAIYLMLVGELLSGGAGSGALIGAVFGLARALPILAVLPVRDPATLRGVQTSLARWERPVRTATFATQSAFAVTAVLAGTAMVA
jgi:hypothetical protein